MRSELELESHSVHLEDGDLLVLFSDGLPETVGRNGEAFGFERLRSLLAEVGSPQRIHDRILMAFDQHLGSESLRDDLTLVVMARQELAAQLPPLPTA